MAKYQGKVSGNSASSQYGIQPPVSETVYREGVAWAVKQEVSSIDQKNQH